jgi:hypothetical protein
MHHFDRRVYVESGDLWWFNEIACNCCIMHICCPADCLTNDGMVSVVFFLIIAYRPLIQSLSLNTAERLAGEDFYPVAFIRCQNAPWLGNSLAYAILPSCPADHVV